MGMGLKELDLMMTNTRSREDIADMVEDLSGDHKPTILRKRKRGGGRRYKVKVFEYRDLVGAILVEQLMTIHGGPAVDQLSLVGGAARPMETRTGPLSMWKWS